jgi:N-methylhydantoinase B
MSVDAVSRTAPGRTVDPVTAEIVRHQVLAIVEEMAATMRNASGSPAITEANDFSVCILAADGEIASYAQYVTLHLGAAKECFEHLLQKHPVETIRPGDRFITNDAGTGSAHLNDTGILAPIFDGDTIIAWAWAEAHLPDYGGWGFGGFAPGASDIYQEGIRLKLVKFVSEGTPVGAVEEILRDNIRMPDLQMNDIRGLLAACNVCDKKMLGLADRYGRDVLAATLRWGIDKTEEVARQRIESIEDGDYASEAWIEHDGVQLGYHKVAVTLRVRGANLEVDFTGTSPQVPGFSNAGPGAVWGFILTPLMHQLAWDLPTNHGLIRPISVVMPEGTLVNPLPPAALSGGHLDGGLHGVQPAISHALSQAASRSSDPELRARACGQFHHSWFTENWFGADDKGAPFLFFNLDGGAQGGGAQTVCDGLHSAGDLCQPDNHMPDVEWYEFLTPMLFLFRRPWRDSGGPGTFRGGTGTEESWLLWGASAASGTLFGQGAEIPRTGLFGGLPSGGHRYEIWRNSELLDRFETGAQPGTYDELTDVAGGAATRFQPEYKVSGLTLTSGDVVYRTLGGGSGFGDPLARDPQRVCEDVRKGLVSTECAAQAYGVVLGAGSLAVDDDATAAVRAKLKDKRVVGTREKAGGGSGPGWPDLAGCDSCRSLVTQEDWRDRTATRTIEARRYLAEVGGWLLPPQAGTVEILEHACPGCGTLLDVVVNVHPAHAT